MLVVLDIEKKYNKTMREKCKGFLHRYEMTKTIKKNGSYSVLEIHYRQNYGKIRFDRIYDLTIGESKTILCSKEISLKGTPFNRFESNEFNIQMMQNFLDKMLSQNGEDLSDIKISFFDPNAEYPSIAEKMVQYLPSLTVVSNMPRFYENESERIKETIGAEYRVSNSLSFLEQSDILVCPVKIKIPLPTTSDTLVFTVQKPIVPLNGIIVTEYCPSMPDWCTKLKPESTDEMYFLSAMYSLYDCAELGKLMPVTCGNNSITFDVDDIIHYAAVKDSASVAV